MIMVEEMVFTGLFRTLHTLNLYATHCELTESIYHAI